MFMWCVCDAHALNSYHVIGYVVIVIFKTFLNEYSTIMFISNTQLYELCMLGLVCVCFVLVWCWCCVCSDGVSVVDDIVMNVSVVVCDVLCCVRLLMV